MGEKRNPWEHMVTITKTQDENEYVAREPDTEIGEDLLLVAEQTRRDGTVEGVITGFFDPDGRDGRDTIVVVGMIPGTNQKIKEKMLFPKRDDPEEYKFVRLCHRAGCTISSAEEHLVGSTVPVKQDGGSWEFYTPIPEPEYTLFEKFGLFMKGCYNTHEELVTGINVLWFGFLLFPPFIKLDDEVETWREAVFLWIMVSMMSVFVWGLTLGVLAILLKVAGLWVIVP